MALATNITPGTADHAGLHNEEREAINALGLIVNPPTGRVSVAGQEIGDTGWRVLSSWTTAGVVTGMAFNDGWGPRTSQAGRMMIRRIGSTVWWGIANAQATGDNPTGRLLDLESVISGFKASGAPIYRSLASHAGSTINLQITDLAVTRHNTEVSNGTIITGAVVSWPAAGSWPSSLPGVAP